MNRQDATRIARTIAKQLEGELVGLDKGEHDIVVFDQIDGKEVKFTISVTLQKKGA